MSGLNESIKDAYLVVRCRPTPSPSGVTRVTLPVLRIWAIGRSAVWRVCGGRVRMVRIWSRPSTYLRLRRSRARLGGLVVGRAE
jgi:hypothetical protein